MKTAAAIEGRRADTTRRRERVLAALTKAHSSGHEISVATIARTAGVDRTFLYRLAIHIQTLERRLSETLGEQVWRESGLGAPQDLEELNQRITRLESRASI